MRNILVTYGGVLVTGIFYVTYYQGVNPNLLFRGLLIS